MTSLLTYHFLHSGLHWLGQGMARNLEEGVLLYSLTQLHNRLPYSVNLVYVCMYDVVSISMYV